MDDPVPPPMSSQPPPEETPPPILPKPDWDSTTRSWVVGLHLSALFGLLLPYIGNILGPVIIWTLKKNEYPALEPIGKHVINFQITVTIAALISSLLLWVCIGMILLPLVGIAWLVLVIVAAVKASNGEEYRYPCTYAFLK